MIIFDLETIPREDFSEQFLLYRSENIPYKELKLGNLKDTDKIALKVAEVDEHNRKLKKNFRNDDAKDVDYAQIICAAIKVDVNDVRVVTTASMEEEELINKLLTILSNNPGPIVGYNHSGYDIPLIKRVCLRYEIKVPPIFSRDSLIDIMFLFKENYSMPFKKLIEQAMCYGFDINNKISAGHEILKKYQNNDWAWIKAHVVQDIEATYFLYKMFESCDLLPIPTMQLIDKRKEIPHEEKTL